MNPPYGYQLIDNGELQSGDMFWSFKSRSWTPVLAEKVGHEIDESVRICRPESEIANYDGVTGYFAFVDNGDGDYHAAEFYGDQQPAHSELIQLANQHGRIVLIHGQIVDEADPEIA